MKYLSVPQSGSQADTTASRNRFGQYYRNRRSPVQPRTPAQTGIRAIFADCSSAWSSLTGAERDSWAAWATLHPRTDSLGSTYVMTGLQAFNSVNCLLVTAGAAAVSEPPADPPPGSPTLGALTLTAGDAITLAFTPTPLPAGTRMLVYCTPPLSAGASVSNDLRLIAAFAPAEVSPVDFFSDYQARFGTPAAGQQMIVAARTLVADGGVSTFSATIRQAWAP